jgi:hypothetical protein
MNDKTYGERIYVSCRSEKMENLRMAEQRASSYIVEAAHLSSPGYLSMNPTCAAASSVELHSAYPISLSDLDPSTHIRLSLVSAYDEYTRLGYSMSWGICGSHTTRILHFTCRLIRRIAQ